MAARRCLLESAKQPTRTRRHAAGAHRLGRPTQDISKHVEALVQPQPLELPECAPADAGTKGAAFQAMAAELAVGKTRREAQT